jgi:hypothetical protein
VAANANQAGDHNRDLRKECWQVNGAIALGPTWRTNGPATDPLTMQLCFKPIAPPIARTRTMATRNSDTAPVPIRRAQTIVLNRSTMLARQFNTTQRPAAAEGGPLG